MNSECSHGTRNTVIGIIFVSAVLLLLCRGLFAFHKLRPTYLFCVFYFGRLFFFFSRLVFSLTVYSKFSFTAQINVSPRPPFFSFSTIYEPRQQPLCTIYSVHCGKNPVDGGFVCCAQLILVVADLIRSNKNL